MNERGGRNDGNSGGKGNKPQKPKDHGRGHGGKRAGGRGQGKK